MNLFILSLIPTEAAEAMMDKHVSKILLEAVQMLCTAMHVLVPETPIKDQLYKVAHLNHPVSIWVRESRENFIWTLDLVEALHEEWRFRYDHPESKQHRSYVVAQLLRHHVPRDKLFPCPRAGLTPFALAMPDEYKADFKLYGLNFTEAEHVEQAIANADVVLVEPVIQADYSQSRQEAPKERPLTPANFKITRELLMSKAKSDMTLLHSLPRMDEIPPDVDITRWSRYWQEAFYGVVMRMALIALVLGGVE